MISTKVCADAASRGFARSPVHHRLRLITFPMRTPAAFVPPVAGLQISRFPNKERRHMPGSTTTPGQLSACENASSRVAFRWMNNVGARGISTIAAQWLAYVILYRRFANTLADAHARLGASVVRYSFTAVDLHHLLLAGLPALSSLPAQMWGIFSLFGMIDLDQQRGAIPNDTRASETAKSLVTLMVGLRVLARGTFDATGLLAIKQNALRLISN